MADSKEKWGKKHNCPECKNKFYDLNKTPITCPNCKTVIDLKALNKKKKATQKANLIQDDIIDTEFTGDDSISDIYIEDDLEDASINIVKNEDE